MYIDKKYLCKQKDMVGNSNYNYIKFLCNLYLDVFVCGHDLLYDFSLSWTVPYNQDIFCQEYKLWKKTLGMALDCNVFSDPQPMNT